MLSLLNHGIWITGFLIKKQRIIPLLCSCLVCLILTGCNPASQSLNTFWYDSPAEHWMEALPLGNGRLGAKVYGQPGEEQIQLNEESLWAGCPEDPYPEDIKKHYACFQRLNLSGKFEEALQYGMENLTISPTSIRSYQTLGDLYIRFMHGRATNYKRSLNLEEGIHTVAYEVEGHRFIRESFISSKYNSIFYHFRCLDQQLVSCDIHLLNA